MMRQGCLHIACFLMARNFISRLAGVIGLTIAGRVPEGSGGLGAGVRGDIIKASWQLSSPCIVQPQRSAGMRSGSRGRD